MLSMLVKNKVLALQLFMLSELYRVVFAKFGVYGWGQSLKICNYLKLGAKALWSPFIGRGLALIPPFSVPKMVKVSCRC